MFESKWRHFAKTVAPCFGRSSICWSSVPLSESLELQKAGKRSEAGAPSSVALGSDMAKNDAILVDGIIDQRVDEAFPSSVRSEVFEYFCFEQVLKNYDLSPEEIESGWVDGRDDGGIDGFFTLINGHLFRDPEDFSWPKTNCEITVWILTCKHHDTFQQSPLNSLVASVAELFDLSIDRKELKGSYSRPVLEARASFHAAYRRLAVTRPSVRVRLAYVSRGDIAAVEPNVQARANQIVETIRSLFSSCECQFDFIGAAELIAMYRRAKKFSLELPVCECLSHGESAYVVLARVEEIARFVTDDVGNLRRYLFDSNVRDYLGSTQINDDILISLREAGSLDFWWLNNGVTILVTAATVVGRTIHLENIQIVNGLQTTETIFQFFKSGGVDPVDRSLLVKIIVSTDNIHRDRIIQATNNQNIVEVSGLRATDKVQRDIEEFLDRHGWYYERRKNYFKNFGKPAERFVTPAYLAAGYVSLVLKRPAAATRLRMKFMRQDASYRLVFSDETPIETWLAVTETLKRIDSLLQEIQADRQNRRVRPYWRYPIALIAVARLLGRYSFSVPDLMRLDATRIDTGMVTEILQVVHGEMREPHKRSFGRSPGFIKACCLRAAKDFGIANVEAVHKGGLPTQAIRAATQTDAMTVRCLDAAPFSAAFIDRVDKVLPEQPWKLGVHLDVADSLGCTAKEAHSAIKALIESGRRKSQRDGVVLRPDVEDV